MKRKHPGAGEDSPRRGGKPHTAPIERGGRVLRKHYANRHGVNKRGGGRRGG